jgi:long-chain acyl-CoA synthetase
MMGLTLKALSPYIANAYVHGDRRPFLTALVTLAPDAVAAWARSEGIPFDEPAELSVRLEVRGLIQRAVNRLNATLEPSETIRRFAILPADFSHSTGELTPTGKLRRRECAAKYAEVLDRLYEG